MGAGVAGTSISWTGAEGAGGKYKLGGSVGLAASGALYRVGGGDGGGGGGGALYRVAGGDGGGGGALYRVAGR